ncbi:U4/U6 small nuclear ribonucleoprotein Prp31-like isoform X2 [Symsagittifera roscoffensis]
MDHDGLHNGSVKQEPHDSKHSIQSQLCNSVKEIAKLYASEDLKTLLALIEQYQNEASSSKSKIVGPVEQDPEYKLIVSANNTVLKIDNEIYLVHKFIRDRYTKRFPELESLVPSALDYINTVLILKNDLSKAKSSDELAQILNPATVMVVSVSAATTTGKFLDDEVLASIIEACDMAKELHEVKTKILSYVESRMSLIAPNLSNIVGASIAAKLMGISGGLTGLSKMPACNVQVLGAQKASMSGFSSIAVNPHSGLVFQCEIVQQTAPDLKRKAAKFIAAKASLAARVDSNHSCPSGSIGMQFREEIMAKLTKLNEPPSVKQTKALPTPIDAPRKRRGGRRFRKMKARLGETELRKQANRMNFGEVEDDMNQEDLGFTLGNIGKSSQTGGIRMAQVDKKTEVKLSKSLQRKLAKDQIHGGRTTVRQQISGTASSVAFTPLEGLEIKNPNAASENSSKDDKYFAATSGFLSVKPVIPK